MVVIGFAQNTQPISYSAIPGGDTALPNQAKWTVKSISGRSIPWHGRDSRTSVSLRDRRGIGRATNPLMLLKWISRKIQHSDAST
jgi:hypothetical protein